MPSRLARFIPSLVLVAQLAAPPAHPLAAQRPAASPTLSARFDSLVAGYLGELPSAGLSAAAGTLNKQRSFKAMKRVELIALKAPHRRRLA